MKQTNNKYIVVHINNATQSCWLSWGFPLPWGEAWAKWPCNPHSCPIIGPPSPHVIIGESPCPINFVSYFSFPCRKSIQLQVLSLISGYIDNWSYHGEELFGLSFHYHFFLPQTKAFLPSHVILSRDEMLPKFCSWYATQRQKLDCLTCNEYTCTEWCCISFAPTTSLHLFRLPAHHHPEGAPGLIMKEASSGKLHQNAILKYL